MKESVQSVLETLDVREKQVIEHRFGMKDGRSKTLEEVGRLLWRYPRTRKADRSKSPAQTTPSNTQRATTRLR